MIIALVQESAINTRGTFRHSPAAPGGGWHSPALLDAGFGAAGLRPAWGEGEERGAKLAGGGGALGTDPACCTPGWGRSRVPGCCREDKGNILRGCNVNRVGAEPLFMESLSCQGICQGPDLHSYLDKGAGEGERSWRQSHSTAWAAARRELIRGCPRVGG